MIQILLVDDHPSVLEGTKLMIEKEPDMQVSVETCPKTAYERIKNEQFDVLMFDLHMSKTSGLDLARRAISLNPDAIVLIYTGFDIIPHLNVLIDAGVVGFVSKTASGLQLITAIRCALRHEIVLPISILRDMRANRNASVVQEEQLTQTPLNKKEIEILSELARGKSNKEIASAMFMGQRSLEYILSSLFQKLGVKSRVEAVAKSKQKGMIN